MSDRLRTIAAGAALGAPWPDAATAEPGGIAIGGELAEALVSRFGTPLIVMDEEQIRSRCRSLRSRFPRVLYAVKAFTAYAAIRIALDEGLGLLASTGGEVEACTRAGAPGSAIVLHGNNKSDEELAAAVRAGVSLVVADHGAELARLDAIAQAEGRVQPFLLRIVPRVSVRTHEAIATGHDASKFGTPPGEAVAVVREATSMAGVRFEGLHAHIGSQILEVDPYRRAVDALVAIAVRLRDDAGIATGTLDVGGGFGVRYLTEDPPDDGRLARGIVDHLAARCEAAGLPVPSLVVEPGRSLMANAGLTLYRVGSRKTVGERTLLAVDGGMSDNLRPMLYDARYSVRNASAPGGGEAGPEAAFTVVGRHCESGDTLAEDVLLPAETGPGDLLAFAATGAYTYALSTNYNQVGKPAVVGIAAGAARPWIRREDAADLQRLDVSTPRDPGASEPPPGITVRPARPADATGFLAFWSRVVAEGGYVRSERVAHPAREYRRRFRRPWTEHDAQLVAVDGRDRVVGHVSMQRERHPVTSHVATLGIAVDADHRGTGVGSALLAEAFRWARSGGVEKVVLSVYPSNAGAIALYRKFGFVQEGRLARQSRKSTGYQDEILMGAWIGPADPGT